MGLGLGSHVIIIVCRKSSPPLPKKVGCAVLLLLRLLHPVPAHPPHAAAVQASPVAVSGGQTDGWTSYWCVRGSGMRGGKKGSEGERKKGFREGGERAGEVNRTQRNRTAVAADEGLGFAVRSAPPDERKQKQQQKETLTRRRKRKHRKSENQDGAVHQKTKKERNSPATLPLE